MLDQSQLFQAQAACQRSPERQIFSVIGLTVRQNGSPQLRTPPQQLDHHVRRPVPACTDVCQTFVFCQKAATWVTCSRRILQAATRPVRHGPEMTLSVARRP